MRLSKAAIKTSKTLGQTDSFINEFLVQAGKIKQFTAGLYALDPLMTKAKHKLDDFIRYHLDRYDCAEVSFPLLQAKKYWTNSGRWEPYLNSGNTFITKGRSFEYFLSPTAEELSTEYMNSCINSYKDLDVIIYQIGAKFRDEIRVAGGMLKTKEFSMMDAYSFDENYENMIKNYQKMYNCYMDIFNDLGLKVIPVKAINDMGGKVSDEFMIEDKTYGQDTILYSEKDNLAFNTEVLENEELKKSIEESYPGLDLSSLKELKTIELGHMFQNNTFYSTMMNGKFMAKNGKSEHYYNGCYGIGVSRLLTVLIIKSFEKYNKFVWNDKIAPFKLCLISLNDQKINEECEKIYKLFMDNGIEILYDDRPLSIGNKINDNELNGVRYNMICGKNFAETGKIELEDRTTNEKQYLTAEEIIKMFK